MIDVISDQMGEIIEKNYKNPNKNLISCLLPFSESFKKIYHKSAQFYASKKEESKEEDQGLKKRKRKKSESKRFVFFLIN